MNLHLLNGLKKDLHEFLMQPKFRFFLNEKTSIRFGLRFDVF